MRRPLCMRNFCRLLLLLSLSIAALPPLHAQVLARPGWEGSGVTAEPWWRRAVFYRIDPTRFQATGTASVGDIPGITQRLDYLQRLGIDAIIVTPQPIAASDAFAELARTASQTHLRVLIELPTPDLDQARLWLNQGAAGIYLNPKSIPPAGAAHQLRQLTDSFPGGRVLLSSANTGGAAQLTLASDLAATSQPSALALRTHLAANLDGLNPAATPLLALTGTPAAGGNAARQAIFDRTLALMLLASRAAVMIDAGRELGLRSPDASPVLMQWTPSDRTAAAPDTTPKPAVPKAEVYGAYTPYVPPAKGLSAPPMPVVVASETAPPSDLNTLPGFTAGDLPDTTAVNGAVANAASEEADPASLLNFYRHLIALHHDDWTLRNGTQTILDRDASNALVWIRRAPGGSRTFASIVAAINLSDQPVDLDLRADLARMRMSPGALRPLLTASTTAMLSSAANLLPPESAGNLTLPASTLFLGELWHEEATLTTSHRRRHRR